MCSVPAAAPEVASEPLERADGLVAVGAEVRHVLQAVHAEGDQAASVHTAYKDERHGEHRDV